MTKFKDGYVINFDEKMEEAIYRLDVLRATYARYIDLEETYVDIAVRTQKEHFKKHPDDTEFFYKNETFDKSLEQYANDYDRAIEVLALAVDGLRPKIGEF